MPYGWVEYRISRDAGKTFSDFYTLQYSLDSFLDGIHTISVEKAVACDDGTIVAFCLRNDAYDPQFCEPWDTPTWIVSRDQGETWSEPQVYSRYRGRTYDATYRDGVIYVLHYCNEHFLGSNNNHVYRLYVSTDNGKSFEERSFIPFDTIQRGYGAMQFDAEGRLHAYAYNASDEVHMDHAVSTDNGFTWEVTEPCFVAKGIRNPQVGCVDGVYVLHGRSGDLKGLVLYTSTDAFNWDEGVYLRQTPGAAAYYSNNLNLCDEKGNFLLVQYSDPYDMPARVNVNHMKLRVKK
ncbi:MAG: exo-alpha-sialidase [Clostridia bacterium]|nr:exo-alpha-sialidase [Clostridia bacterium]